MLNLRLAILAGLVLGPPFVVAGRLARRYGLSSRVGSDVAWWGVVGYVVAARVVWIALHPWVLRYPVDALRVTQGLLTPAGVVGAAAAVAALRWWRYRDASWAAVGCVAAAGAAAATAGWYGGCWLQGRCGGLVVAWGPALEAGVPQLPVGPAAALVCAAVVAWLWRAAAPRLGRAWAATGTVLAVVAFAGALGLRARPWPTGGDLTIALLALVALGWAARCRSDVAGHDHEREQVRPS